LACLETTEEHTTTGSPERVVLRIRAEDKVTPCDVSVQIQVTTSGPDTVSLFQFTENGEVASDRFLAIA